MFAVAGRGIAVANAAEGLKLFAQDITLSNNEDGVGFALRNYFPTTERYLDANRGPGEIDAIVDTSKRERAR